MDEQDRKDEHTIRLTPEDLARLTPGELTTLLLAATTVQATCVVRRADGSIRYDDPSLAGTYGEAHLTGDDNGGDRHG